MRDHLWTRLLLWPIADLGHVGVALPIAAIVLAWLCVRRQWQTGLWFAVFVLGCSAAILFLKLAFFAGALRPTALGLRNPSGHSALGAVVYGSLGWMLSRDMPGWRGRMMLLLGGAAAVAIGASLYLKGVHTLADVVAGLTLGGAGAGAFAKLGCRGAAPVGGAPARLVVLIAVAVLSLQGLQLIARIAPTNLLMLVPSLTAPA